MNTVNNRALLSTVVQQRYAARAPPPPRLRTFSAPLELQLAGLLDEGHRHPFLCPALVANKFVTYRRKKSTVKTKHEILAARVTTSMPKSTRQLSSLLTGSQFARSVVAVEVALRADPPSKKLSPDAALARAAGGAVAHVPAKLAVAAPMPEAEPPLAAGAGPRRREGEKEQTRAVQPAAREKKLLWHRSFTTAGKFYVFAPEERSWTHQRSLKPMPAQGFPWRV